MVSVNVLQLYAVLFYYNTAKLLWKEYFTIAAGLGIASFIIFFTDGNFKLSHFIQHFVWKHFNL